MARTRRHQIPENQGRISKPQAESVTEAVDMTSVQAPLSVSGEANKAAED